MRLTASTWKRRQHKQTFQIQKSLYRKSVGFYFKPVTLQYKTQEMKEVADIKGFEGENIDFFIQDNGPTRLYLSDNRYIKPRIKKEISERRLKYKYAEDLAKDIEISENSRYFIMLNGSFIFGDFIEALLVEKNYHVKKLYISTLSLSQNNADSLRNLIVGNYVDDLNLLVSTMFYSHERKSLVEYLYEKCDIDNKFQLSVARVHTKIVLIETHCGKKIVMHGSANLRTSGNMEQMCIEVNEPLYDFNMEVFSEMVESYKTINKNNGKRKKNQTDSKV